MGNIFNFTESEKTDIKKGLILAMKELDKNHEGTDKQLSDRLEIIFNRISDGKTKK